MLLLLSANAVPFKSTAQAAVSFQVFYDNLSPYGNWVTYPGYGYVWVPNAGSDFRPYVSGGHWVYSDDGWVWASDYDWGWAPFHYGSWMSDPAYGWMWVPGYDWAPAWVTWGSYNGYYGWAPCAPGFSVSAGYYPPMDRWCFVEPRYMARGDWGSHYYVEHGGRISIGGGIVITNERRITSVSNTANYGGHGYYAGPRREEFERVAHTTITPVSIRESNTPGRARLAGNTVNVYRPQINAGTKVYSRPAKAVPMDKGNARQRTANNAGGRGMESRPAINNNVHPSNQQAHPANQQQQGIRSGNNRQMQQPGNNAAPTQHQQMSPAQQPQHAAPQQRAQPAQNMQHQPSSRPAAQSQQREQMPREQAPRGEPQREEGRPKGYR